MTTNKILPNLPDRQAWLEWRRQGIGASDTPIILGLSKHKTPFELFELKTGRKPDTEETNFAIEKGNRLEPIARQKFAARYNLQHDCDEEFQPRLVQVAELPHIRASLDGLSHDGQTLIEIKYQGKEAHEAVLKGTIRDAYYAQIQHQMFVSGAVNAHLVSIGDDETVHSYRVPGDLPFMAKIVEHANIFMGWVRSNRWPGESENQALLEWFKSLELINAQIKQLEQLKKNAQEAIYQTGVEVCGDWRVDTITRIGNVDYSKIPELKGLNLDQYRKPATTFKQIKKC